jgi:hypothetical protein
VLIVHDEKNGFACIRRSFIHNNRIQFTVMPKRQPIRLENFGDQFYGVRGPRFRDDDKIAFEQICAVGELRPLLAKLIDNARYRSTLVCRRCFVLCLQYRRHEQQGKRKANRNDLSHRAISASFMLAKLRQKQAP